MADNTTTYKATVEVETKGAENIDLLNKTISTSIGEFENLNEGISKLQDTLGKLDPKSAKFKELKTELNGLQEKLETSTLASGKFVDALAGTQGVTGLVGQSIKGLGQTMKVFAANPIIAVVTGLVGAFMLLKESMSKTAEGQETLNRISAAFGKIIGPVMAIVEKVALPIFELLATLLEKVANGFNKFAKYLGISSAKIEEASRNSSEVLQKAYEEENTRQEEQTKKQEEQEAKRLEARQKAAEKRKAQMEKEAEEERKLQEDAAKILLEASLSSLSERDRQLKEREMRFQEELKLLKAAGVTDLLLFEAEYKNDQLEINKKFDDEILKQQEETNKKKAEEQKKSDDEAKKQKEEFDKFIVDSEQFKTDSLAFIQDMQTNNAAQVGNILGMIAGKNKKLAIAGLVLEQGANIAKVVIDTARGISAATAAAAPFMANPFTAIPATANLARVIVQQKISAALSIAGIIAGAAKGISQINQADIPGGGGSAPGGGGGGGVNIPAPTLTAAQAPQIQSGQGVDPTSQISQAIAGAGQKPMRAYVVSQDVSSQQALDRRTNVAATFSG